MFDESGPRTSGPRPVFAPAAGAAAAAAPFAYPHARRVTRGRELDALRQAGRRVRAAHLDARVAPGPPPSRVGIVVPKHRHGSVERNRVKRRLRELARLHLLPALPSGLVWLRARPEAYRASFAELAHDVARVAREGARLLAASPAVPAADPSAVPSADSGVGGA